MMLINILSKVLIICVALGFTIQSNNLSSQFNSFQIKHKKNYSQNEMQYRLFVYLQNKKMIEEHNSNLNKSFTMEINKFADLTSQQFKQSFLGTFVTNKHQNIDFVQSPQIQNEIEIDWRKEGKVTRVKDQLMCGSCWAFASIGSLQSAHMIKTGIYSEFSQQQLVDCSHSYGNNGCHGGDLQPTFRYLKEKGVQLQQNYPYIGKDHKCKLQRHNHYKIKQFNKDITCGGLYRSLVNGPVAVAVEALFWAYYKEGIFSGCGNQINHGVLVVGVTKDYWLIKNSWGQQWGDNGYIKLARGNTCSVCEFPFSPIL